MINQPFSSVGIFCSVDCYTSPYTVKKSRLDAWGTGGTTINIHNNTTKDVTKLNCLCHQLEFIVAYYCMMYNKFIYLQHGPADLIQ